MKKSKKTPPVLLRKRHVKQELKASCVAAAARMLLDYHGIAGVSEAELRRILKNKSHGTHLFNLLFLQDEKRWGLDVEISKGSPNELFATISIHKIPVIVFVNTASLPHWDEMAYHVVLAVGYDEEFVIVNDPFFDEKEIQVLMENFIKAWGKNDNYMVVIKKKGEVG
ncbi:MAG: cysteine peptidase family C39 domain-containing protein [candidate division KSB1 bacterium]|nr:cysteine peptidase family C39 domain-containing protein [candidate division KSB1 bacterium]MDZ7368006.1 cysteine peptidase family C39 domain-containing protein [candidate division KSB1 bacterium]MDZ7405629.1 cysteine peptidase family C39 domain-containing protein [candidate division KSB1 bacterium]